MKKAFYIILGGYSIFINAQKKWTLQESIDYAIKNNLQIISKAETLKFEEKNLQMIRNEYLPNVSVGMNNKLSFGQTQGFQGGIGRNDNFNNDLTASANLLIYNGKRLEKQKQQKEYEVEIAKYNVDIVKNNISLQIIQQYLSILLNKEIVKVNQSAVENAEKSYNKAKITTEIGTTSRAVLAEAESSLAKEKQNLNLAEIEVKRSLFSLSQLLQLKDYHLFEVEDTIINEEILPNFYSLDYIIEKTFSHHPQIKMALSNIKFTETQTKVTKTAFFPTISLNAGIGTFYYNSLVTNITGIDTFGNYIKEKTLTQQYIDNFYQQVLLSISIPIFNKGNTKIRVEQAKINENIARNNLEIQKQELLQNIQKVYFDMESYYQTYLASQETEKSTRLALDFAEKSYEVGKTSIYDLNIVRNNYTNARSSQIQAKYNYIFAQKILKFYMNFML